MPPTRPAACRLAAACITVLASSGVAHAQAQSDQARIQALETQLQVQQRRLDSLEGSVNARDEEIAGLRRALDGESLAGFEARGAADAQAPVPAANADMFTPIPRETSAAAAQARPSGTTADRVGEPLAEQPREVARIFDQPSVLTPKGAFLLEPSLQFGYSTSDRVALVGFTVIPAILIGLIDVRQVKTTTSTAALTGRYGLTRRLEVEARVPYSYIGSDTVSREIFTGSSQDRVFEAEGRGLGDVEIGARYQLNQPTIDKPFYVGWLRYKSRTGKDPFDVVIDCVQRCIGNTTGTGLPLELATGSGFDALQAGMTWLYTSDPAVFFGSFSYLHNFERKNVWRKVLNGEREFIGDVDAGDIVGFNVGMGLALNEKASISLGYDQHFVGRTKQNGDVLPGAVRTILGTLLVGTSYRFNDKRTLNLSLGVGVTRDTPDISLTVRTPFAF